jgi:phage gp46-like protein
MNYTDGDVLLLSTEDGGDLSIMNGLVEMTGGFETAVFISLFGGNVNDNGTDATKPDQFWGNLLDSDNPDESMVSITQNILLGLPATPANLNLVDQAIQLDLNWMKTNNIADEINIDLSITSKNRINIEIEILKNKELLVGLEFEKNWLAQSNKN